MGGSDESPQIPLSVKEESQVQGLNGLWFHGHTICVSQGLAISTASLVCFKVYQFLYRIKIVLQCRHLPILSNFRGNRWDNAITGITTNFFLGLVCTVLWLHTCFLTLQLLTGLLICFVLCALIKYLLCMPKWPKP